MFPKTFIRETFIISVPETKLINYLQPQLEANAAVFHFKQPKQAWTCAGLRRLCTVSKYL